MEKCLKQHNANFLSAHLLGFRWQLDSCVLLWGPMTMPWNFQQKYQPMLIIYERLGIKLYFIRPDQFQGFKKRLTADLYPADFAWVPNRDNEGKGDTNDPRTVQVAGVCHRSVQIVFDEDVTYQAIQQIYDMAQ